MNTMTTSEVEQAILNNADTSIIDVRETDEVSGGKIPGAVNIPLSLLEFRKQELDKNKEHIIVCYSGARSGRAVEYLAYQGYKVVNMIGGMQEWKGSIE